MDLDTVGHSHLNGDSSANHLPALTEGTNQGTDSLFNKRRQSSNLGQGNDNDGGNGSSSNLVDGNDNRWGQGIGDHNSSNNDMV